MAAVVTGYTLTTHFTHTSEEASIVSIVFGAHTLVTREVGWQSFFSHWRPVDSRFRGRFVLI